jgi:hypothetical protein
MKTYFQSACSCYKFIWYLSISIITLIYFYSIHLQTAILGHHRHHHHRQLQTTDLSHQHLQTLYMTKKGSRSQVLHLLQILKVLHKQKKINLYHIKGIKFINNNIEDITFFSLNIGFIFIQWYDNKYFMSDGTHKWNMIFFVTQDENMFCIYRKYMNFCFII